MAAESKKGKKNPRIQNLAMMYVYVKMKFYRNTYTAKNTTHQSERLTRRITLAHGITTLYLRRIHLPNALLEHDRHHWNEHIVQR